MLPAHTGLTGPTPPYTDPTGLIKEIGLAPQAKVGALCNNCAPEGDKCTTYGLVGGLFAGGAMDDTYYFDCDKMKLPYVCEQLLGGTPWEVKIRTPRCPRT